MDYHSVMESTALFHFTILTITPAASAVLIFLVVILFIISFLVSGSEVAFFSLTYKDINLLKTKQQPSFKRIITLLEQPKTLLGALFITNSLANIGIILISNVLIDGVLDVFHLSLWVNFLMKIFTITFLIVLFGEVLPKVWATHHKIWFASTASLIIEIFNHLFNRLSKRLVGFGDNIEEKFSYKKLDFYIFI